MDKTIETALNKAAKLKPGQTALVGATLGKGMVLAIEYHTVGKTNVCDNYEKMTSEHFDWKKAGCKNNREWRAYLNRTLWIDYRAGLTK